MQLVKPKTRTQPHKAKPGTYNFEAGSHPPSTTTEKTLMQHHGSPLNSGAVSFVEDDKEDREMDDRIVFRD